MANEGIIELKDPAEVEQVMKEITMKITAEGSVDGIHAQLWEKGKSYVVPERLADNFIGSGRAVLVRELGPHEQHTTTEERAAAAAPENKAHTSSPEDKAPEEPEVEEETKSKKDKKSTRRK